MLERTIETESAGDSSSPGSGPKPWSDPNPNRPVPFWSSVRDDLAGHVSPSERPRTALRWALLAAKVGLTLPGFKVTCLYRLNHSLISHAGMPGKVAAGLVSRATHFIFHSAIAPDARLHGGLILPHPQGVTIGSRVVVGPRTWIFHNVTLASARGKPGEPALGSNCAVFTGAVISGPVVLGDGVIVSPNSLVQRDVPSFSLAVGVPANVFPKFTKPKA
jgi:serine O-acetyltransferase